MVISIALNKSSTVFSSFFLIFCRIFLGEKIKVGITIVIMVITSSLHIFIPNARHYKMLTCIPLLLSKLVVEFLFYHDRVTIDNHFYHEHLMKEKCLISYVCGVAREKKLLIQMIWIYKQYDLIDWYTD